MRTTIELSEETAKAVEAVRRDLGVGVSEAVNELVRRGLLPRDETVKFRQRTRSLGMKVDVSNIAATLEVLEGVEAR